jgi:hypothetical protein
MNRVGKRSWFPRRKGDVYDTPASAVVPLLPYLARSVCFAEPCAGSGELIKHLMKHGHTCRLASDIAPRAENIYQQALGTLARHDFDGIDMVITNPPWSRAELHEIILHLRRLDVTAWLLLDANWMFTEQAIPHLRYCAHIVTIGRVRWIPGTTMSGKDDAAWFLFYPDVVDGTMFHGKQPRQQKGKQK